MMDTETLIRIAVLEDPDVRAHVEDATLEQIVAVPPPDDPDHNPLIGDTYVYRAVEPADYVAAIHEHIEKFDGLSTADVTEAAVAAVLPQEEEQ